MNLGVNLLWLRPGGVGGAEEHICRHLVGLKEVAPPDLDVTLYALPGFRRTHPEVEFPVVAAPIGRGRRAIRIAAESSWLAARTRKLDIIHHAGGTVPAVARVPSVVTVHDLQYLTYPATFSTVKLTYLRLMVPRSVRRARIVCVPSTYVRSTVIDRLGTPASKVVVVPHGIPTTERASEATPVGELRARLALPGPVVVFPAITYTHKNHVVLIEALARLARSQPDLRLVLLGRRGPAEDDLNAHIDRLGVRSLVVRPGRVSDADRNGLYAMATALAFPSRYEGFGAPVLEAMRFGCPVIAADATALPEVVGDAGILLPPDEPDAWAKAIEQLIDDRDERDRLIAAGHVRAARFTAAAAGAALLAAYVAAAEL